MNRKVKMEMKIALREAFETPPPERRQEFLKGIPPQKISIFSFMLSQAGYIRKRVLGLSLFLLVLSLTGACFLQLDVLWIISAFMPFIALTAATENFRSIVYGMDELEMSSRFSLRNVVLARMGIIGVLHLILLCLLMPLAYAHSIFTVLQVGVYMLIPYLLTDVVSLWLIRNIRGKEGIYTCVGAAVCVSSLYSIFWGQLINILYMNYFGWLIAALIALIILCVKETKKMVQRTEELA